MARKPLWVELDGLNVLVAGGGPVGERRALWFLEGGANVVVAAMEFTSRLVEEAKRNPRLRLHRCNLETCPELEELVRRANIVVIALPKGRAYERVWSLATAAGKLINDAADASKTMIVVPYYGEAYNGLLKVAVTSEGEAGLAARHALYTLLACLESDEELRTLFEAFRRAKRLVKKLVPDPKERMKIYFELEEILLARGAASRGLSHALREVAEHLAARTGQNPSRLLGELLARS